MGIWSKDPEVIWKPPPLDPFPDDKKTQVIDPVKFISACWPDVILAPHQREILYSVRDNDETFVSAGNGLGKDFIAALVTLWWFVSRRPARVVTTSVKHDQLNDVLWGELRRFINTSRMKLPIQYNHMKIRQVKNNGAFVDLTELVGQVINQGEGLLGRHLPKDIHRTLVVFDEASGISDTTYKSVETWAHTKLIIGNPWPCANFFYKGVKAGDLIPVTMPGHKMKRMYRKVIKVKAEESPNVALGLEQERQGIEPTNQTLIPGMISYEDYKKRRLLWDKVMQCISLDGEFYEGSEVLLYPPLWLNLSARVAASLEGRSRKAKAMGIDTARGGDNTAWCVVDELGVMFLDAMKTPDTSMITKRTLALMHEYDLAPENVLFDAGGGGAEHADRLRDQGYKVRTVAFGETASNPNQFRRMRTSVEKTEEKENRYIYKNRRAEMYGILRQLLDPINEDAPRAGTFGIPLKYTELRRQLAPIPLWYDEEGRLYLPSKQPKPADTTNKTENRKVTMWDLVKCSPDEADALSLAVFGMTVKVTRAKAGAI